MTTASTQLDVDALNRMFEKPDPAAIVEWAASYFGSELVMSSSFGAESAMLIHLAHRVMPEMKIIFVDTGYLFPETHAFMEQLRQRFNLNIATYRTRNDPAEYLLRAGEDDPSRRKNADACCDANKNEPFDRAMRELAPKGWLRGIRRDQNAVRKESDFLEWAPRYRCHAVSPLLNQSRRDIHAYLKKFNLPYHALAELGYASIGCMPCTRPVGEGEDPRAGRWSGQDKIECGINITRNSLDSANL